MSKPKHYPLETKLGYCWKYEDFYSSYAVDPIKFHHVIPSYIYLEMFGQKYENECQNGKYYEDYDLAMYHYVITVNRIYKGIKQYYDELS